MTEEPIGTAGRADRRPETPEQRSDRNWNELLQELRVMQTGVQILTGFLLILPFQARFGDLDDYQRAVYLVLVLVCVATTGLLVAPVALHRALFRKHLKRSVVTGGDLMARAGLVLLAVALSGTALLIFDVVVGRAAGLVVGGAAAVVLLSLWAVVPAVVRRRS
ncbi:DUF6328 family protein [Isoptericola sp. NPDC057653]|uniref:DUF6328 family protein n=1 Tax=unclassified Isoptericola TaxID=2623355 RepID=UPI0036C8525D